jgi:diaminopimelate epimerase
LQIKAKKMLLKFTKMQGTGNDFVVIDAINQTIDLNKDQLRFVADRHFGVGCDQILLVEPPGSADMDFRYRIFNSDGGEVQQCGNGARCFVQFVHEKGLTDKNLIRVGTLAGIIEIERQPGGQVTVNMGQPNFNPQSLPLRMSEQEDHYLVNVGDVPVEFGAVSMGNPHAVIIVDNVDTAPVATLGPALESHTLFPERVNVGFMQIVERDRIRLRVFERGAGETLACGTGACAAVVTGIKWGRLNKRVTV